MYLKRKLYNLWFEKRIETETISAKAGSKQVLTQVLIFSFWVMATLRMIPCPISFLILKALYKGFQMMYCLFLNSFQKVIKRSKRIEWKPKGAKTYLCQYTKHSVFLMCLLSAKIQIVWENHSIYNQWLLILLPKKRPENDASTNVICFSFNTSRTIRK